MNLTLTMQFDNMDELKEFLNRSPGARNTPVAVVTSIEPDIVEQTVAAPIEVPAVDDPLEIAPGGQSPDELRAELMTTLKTKAGSMDEPQILGAFITGFGVQKFSDLPDDMLAPFKAAFTAEFGA